MSRRVIALTVLSLAAVVVIAACQDYNSTPVGACVIQPGSQKTTLEDLTTADILFVVDDSGSMGPMQGALQNGFNNFITSLNAASQARVDRGLDPFDFHIAVTTASVFSNYGEQSKKCVGSAGQTQCCDVVSCSTFLTTSCEPGSVCNGNGRCAFELKQAPPYPPTFGYKCCTVSNCMAKSCVPGDYCPAFGTAYPGDAVAPAVPGAPFAAGNFVSSGSNPKVLHFTKDLYRPTPNTAAINTLVEQFKANVYLGKYGSGQEQHLEAGRLAMQKVLNGQYGSDFPHLGAKLVVVWIGDEDDCSTPNDTAGARVLRGGRPGNDECVADKNLSATSNIPKRLIPLSTYRDFFEGLVAPPGEAPSAARPYRAFSAAFIAGISSCRDSGGTVAYTPLDGYLPAACPAGSTPSVSLGALSATEDKADCVNPVYGGAEISAAGVRFNELANMFRVDEKEVVEASACDDFGVTLQYIADLIKSPSKLKLPSVPAGGEITIVRIVDTGGKTRKVCTQQTTPTSTPATAGGWWFMDCGSTKNPPDVSIAPDKCIYINHDNTTRDCEANPGETYSAEYLGVVPQPNGCTSDADCAAAFKGDARDYNCYTPNGSTKGTCLCRTK